jgi:5-formyltetrahydrofolate cyclo-ligase
MSDTASLRRALRLDQRARRLALHEDDQAAASMAVMARLARLPVLRTARVIAGYRAVRGELDIDAALTLLAEHGAAITVPRVVGEHLEFVRWDPTAQAATTPGSFGIPEPVGDHTTPLSAHDVVLVPLVAFDEHGHRLGQGGGFYDRALARAIPRPAVIGIAHSFQQVASVPTESWDVPIDAVVTEDHILEFRPGTFDPAI